MRRRLWTRWILLVIAAVNAGRPLAAQDAMRLLPERLVDRPLYLRGLWASDKLEFDAKGALVGEAKPGPLTLSGIDVQSVRVDGSILSVLGQRVALIADSSGRLHREAIVSRTHIFGSLRKGDAKNFKANEEIKIVVHEDASHDFGLALRAIFADGLADLAPSVPKYWVCYARGYFVDDPDVSKAKDVVQACVDQMSLARRLGGNGREDDFVPPKLVSSVNPPFTREAAELGVSGVSRVQFTVSQHGIAVGFQIVEAVGAGLDEAALTGLYQAHFNPATAGGKPVVADSDFSMRFALER